MSIATLLHQAGESMRDALEQHAERHAQHEERLRGIEQGVRLELGALTQEIRTERRIADDERAALYLRIDSIDEKLDSIASAISSLTTRVAHD